jgi:[acyl-carrier-protein] S-malonyltransferase
MTLKNLAIVFPGQGSQFVGMLSDIADEFPEVQHVFEQASTVLGYDLWDLVQIGPSEELDKTVRTQPALLAASFAVWQIIQKKKNVTPALLAGHSLGEYTALVCAGALTFKDAIRLVAARGEYMQDAVPVGQGGLAAIVGLSDDDVKQLCDQCALEGEVLSPANFNSPGQVVIAGHLPAVQRATVLAKEKGAKLAKLLPVSVSSHCVLMKPAAEKLSALLATLKIESPPGKVLSGLNKRINGDMQLTSTADLASLQALLESTLENS